MSPPSSRRLVLVTNVSGNASYEYSRAALLAVTEVEAPVEVTSQDLDDQLAEVLTRLRLPGSLLERVAGVRSRRNWDETEDFQEAAARAGADVLARRWTGHHPAVPLGIEEIGAQTKSSGSDWVTDYDRRAEQAVREVVAGYRPSDEITGEEYGATRPAEPSGYRWSIDPLDGTTNFVRGLPQFCTSVAVTGPVDAETADLDEADDDDLTEEREVLSGVEDDEADGND